MVGKIYVFSLLFILLLVSGVWYLTRTTTDTPSNAEDSPAYGSATKVFTSEEMGFSFEYPVRFGVVNAAIYDGDPSGRAFEGTFEKCDEPGCVPLLLTFG